MYQKYTPARQRVEEADEASNMQCLERFAHEVQDDKYPRCIGYRNGSRAFIGNAHFGRANQLVSNKFRSIRRKQIRTKLRIPKLNITAQ